MRFGDGVRSLQDMDFGVHLARQLQMGVQRVPVFPLQIGLRHVGDKKLPMKAVRVAAAALDHDFGVAPGCDTYQDTLLRAPGLMDAV